jgi:hypothetical protein
MGPVRQAMIFAAALASGVSMSQAPEFAQQYRQRIGGAIEALQHVVADFDSDASRNGLTRSEALAAHARAAPLFRDRGRSMEATIARLELLSRQQREFETASTLAQPFLLMEGDRALVGGVWRDFRAAVPVTPAGLAWGAAGFFVGAALAWSIFLAVIRSFGAVFSARRPRSRRAVRGSGLQTAETDNASPAAPARLPDDAAPKTQAAR